jgi:ParB family chromosome partitioning protein
MRELPSPPADPDAVRVIDIPLASIVPNPHQPRREFDETSLSELASSLKSTGMIQPIVVRPVGDGAGAGSYQLIAGERRWRAARLADLPTVPAIVRDVDGATQAQMALIENIQRENLNPLDRALAYRALMDHLGLTQAELATRLGEDRSTVANFLRLLDLTERVQALVRDDKLSMGHAKLLAGVTDKAEQERLARLVVSQSLSVRNLERLIAAGAAAAEAKEKDATAGPSAYLKDLERSLSRQLNLRVQVRASSRQKGRGKLILHYTSLDQFDDLMGRLGAKTE